MESLVAMEAVTLKTDEVGAERMVTSEINYRF
jgi:hypothetical protein